MANTTLTARLKSDTIALGGAANARPQNQAHLRAGPLIINLGCGAKTTDLCVNVDWSIYVILHRHRWLLPLVTPLIRSDRAERIKAMRGAVICHDLRKGIPFPDSSADAVYHSHIMEHIDRSGVPGFQEEIFRVLKPGGIQRLAVPDLERYVSEYNARLAADDGTREASLRHDHAVAKILEQSVRRAPQGIKNKRGLRARLENLILGDARERGETHQWMWDRLNIRAVLMDAGFVDIKVCSWNGSDIEGWQRSGLEVASDGSEYKPESLYLECKKPANG